MSAAYVSEKLVQAVYELATGAGSIRGRLVEAALRFGPARPDQIPYDDLRRRFAGILDDLSFQPAEGEEGRTIATLRITDDEDCRMVAQRIVSLCFELSDRLDTERRAAESTVAKPRRLKQRPRKLGTKRKK